jgi:hypothetical protein
MGDPTTNAETTVDIGSTKSCKMKCDGEYLRCRSSGLPVEKCQSNHSACIAACEIK